MSRISEWVSRVARKSPTRTALVTAKERLSYAELDDAVSRLAGGFRELGVGPESCIAGFCEKRLGLPLTFLAASRLGALFAPLNPRLSHASLRPVIDALPLTAFVTDLDHLGILSTLREAIKAPLVCLDGEPPATDYLRLGDLFVSPPADSPEGDIVYLNFTSGTTGRPKAAVVTNDCLEAATRAACDGLRLTEDDVHLCLFAPFAHPHENFARAFYLGGTAVLLDSMSPKALASTIEKARVTCLMAVPPLYEVTLEKQVASSLYDLSSLRLLEAGGMATPDRLVRRFRDRYGLKILPVWGSTETTGVVLVQEEEFAMRPLPGFSVRLVDETGQSVPDGTPGELVISGAGVAHGYFPGLDAPDGESRSLPRLDDGTFRSGDSASRTGADRFELLGRLDEMRKVGGLKVYPQEIQAQLECHEAIREAAVIFRPERARGVVPVAIVRPERDHDAPTLAELKRFLRGRLPPGLFPREVRQVDSLPKTAAGKLDRKAIEASFDDTKGSSP